MPQGSGRLKCSVCSAPAPGVGGSFEIGLCLEVGAAKAGDLHGGAKRHNQNNRSGISLKSSVKLLKWSESGFCISPLTQMLSLQAGVFGSKYPGGTQDQGVSRDEGRSLVGWGQDDLGFITVLPPGMFPPGITRRRGKAGKGPFPSGT